MKWNGFGIRIDKSMKGNGFVLKTENLASHRPYDNTVELVELCGWHEGKFWKNCIQCVVRKKKTSLSKKKLESFIDEITEGLEPPFCARFAQHFGPVNYGAPCKHCGKKPND